MPRKASFDSALVPISLRPADIEHLLDHYFRYKHADDHEAIMAAALAYADHSRMCGMLALGVYRVVAPFVRPFQQVTSGDLGVVLHVGDDGCTEMQRRFTVSTVALREVSA